MAKLETLVVQEIWETETAAFWKRPGVDPKSIATEVILLPAAFFMEKNGTISELGRHGAVAPRRREAARAGQARRRDRGPRLPRGARSGQGLEGAEGRDHQEGLLDLHHGRGRPARDQRLRAARQPGDRPQEGRSRSARSAICKADGSTSSGAWIYAGVFANGENLSKRRDSQTDPGGLGLYPGFGWTWPNNMRILYNRASCDRNGKPYPGSKPIVWWDEQAKRWTGYDVPDVPVADRRPRHAERPAGLPPGRGGRRAPLRGRLLGPRPEVSPTIGATWPTCRRTARCRRCTSPSRARWKTSFTRA